MTQNEFKALQTIYINAFFNSTCLSLESKIKNSTQELEKLYNGEKSKVQNCDQFTYFDAKKVLEKIMTNTSLMKESVI